MEEYEAVAGRLSHRGYRDALVHIISEIERIGVFVQPADVTFGLRDPDDEVYLATATAGGAALTACGETHVSAESGEAPG